MEIKRNLELYGSLLWMCVFVVMRCGLSSLTFSYHNSSEGKKRGIFVLHYCLSFFWIWWCSGKWSIWCLSLYSKVSYANEEEKIIKIVMMEVVEDMEQAADVFLCIFSKFFCGKIKGSKLNSFIMFVSFTEYEEVLKHFILKHLFCICHKICFIIYSSF